METGAFYIWLDLNHAFILIAKLQRRWKPQIFYPSGVEIC